MHLLLNSCTEPYALQTNSFEEALVVEATITNELKNQEIKISKTFRFDEEGPEFEAGAIVYIEDNVGNTYEFKEKKNLYISTKPFQAIPEREYTLNISTKDGKTYTSKKEILTPITQIESVVTNVTTKNNENGVQISVNTYDPSGKSKLYRYEYEETYRIISPDQRQEIGYLNEDRTGINYVSNKPKVDTCYSSNTSIDIHLASTVGLVENRVNYPIRYISNQDPIIRNRYSILIRQYTQNTEAHTYYQTLKKTAGSDNLLSQSQPGFFYGNIKSTTNPNEKIIGYFEVSSVSEKRVFFNFNDLFPGAQLPPFFYDCTVIKFQWCFYGSECSADQLIGLMVNNNWISTGYIPYSPYVFGAPKQCVDCTEFSSNKKPSFWKD
jgi:hypothetical protein